MGREAQVAGVWCGLSVAFVFDSCTSGMWVELMWGVTVFCVWKGVLFSGLFGLRVVGWRDWGGGDVIESVAVSAIRER